MDVKIPFYNLVNILFIGLIFCCLLLLLMPETIGDFITYLRPIMNSTTIELIFVLAISYQIGLIINWIGSLVVEPLLTTRKPAAQRTKLSRILRIQWRSYKDYQQTETDKLRMLTREMNVARNNLTSFAILSIIAIATNKMAFTIMLWLLIILFYCAYRKHSAKIVSRIDNTVSKN